MLCRVSRRVSCESAVKNVENRKAEEGDVCAP